MSEALLSGGKQSQLVVKIFSMDSVHRIAVLVVVRNQHLHVHAIYQTPFAYGNHAGVFWDKVPRLEDPRGIGLDGDGRSYFVQQR